MEQQLIERIILKAYFASQKIPQDELMEHEKGALPEMKVGTLEELTYKKIKLFVELTERFNVAYENLYNSHPIDGTSPIRFRLRRIGAWTIFEEMIAHRHPNSQICGKLLALYENMHGRTDSFQAAVGQSRIEKRIDAHVARIRWTTEYNDLFDHDDEEDFSNDLFDHEDEDFSTLH